MQDRLIHDSKSLKEAMGIRKYNKNNNKTLSMNNICDDPSVIQ